MTWKKYNFDDIFPSNFRISWLLWSLLSWTEAITVDFTVFQMIAVYQNCPAADYFTERYFRSRSMKEKCGMFKNDFSYLEKHSGLKFPKSNVWLAVWNSYLMWDILTIEVCFYMLRMYLLPILPISFFSIYYRTKLLKTIFISTDRKPLWFFLR